VPQPAADLRIACDNRPGAVPDWREALRAAVMIACSNALIEPGPCALAALRLALRRLHDATRPCEP